MDTTIMDTYVKVPDRILRRKKLSPGAKLLYGIIMSLCQSRGFCWATNSALAERLSLSYRSISRLLAELKRCGLVFCDQNDPGTVGLNVRRLLRLTEPEKETDLPEEDWGEWARRCVAAIQEKRKEQEQDLERDKPENEDSSCFGAPKGRQAQDGLLCPSAPAEREYPPLPEHWRENGHAPQPGQAEEPTPRERAVPREDSAAGMPEGYPVRQENPGLNRQSAPPQAPSVQKDKVLEDWMAVRHRDWCEGDKRQFAMLWRAYWLDWVRQGKALPDRADRHSFLERLNRLAEGDRETMQTILQRRGISPQN